MTLHKVAGALYISDLKNDGSSQKSVVRQLKRKDSSDEAALICAGRLFHARAAATRKVRSPRVTRRAGGTSSVVVSAEGRWRRATNSDVGRRLSARYAGAVPCTQSRHRRVNLRVSVRPRIDERRAVCAARCISAWQPRAVRTVFRRTVGSF